MSTHAAVGRRTGETSWEGAYVHFDGYPEGVGAELTQIIARDGAAKTLETVLAQPDWRCVEADYKAETGLFGNDQVSVIAGYGEYYTDRITPPPLQTDAINSVHYVYLIAEDGSIETLNLYG